VDNASFEHMFSYIVLDGKENKVEYVRFITHPKQP